VRMTPGQPTRRKLLDSDGKPKHTMASSSPLPLQRRSEVHCARVLARMGRRASAGPLASDKGGENLCWKSACFTTERPACRS
jgi:hypothetical protein